MSSEILACPDVLAEASCCDGEFPSLSKELAFGGRRRALREARVAIVHDWLPLYGGAERVLEQIIRVFPQADLFSLFDFIPERDRGFLSNKPVTTSFLQRWPLAKRCYRAYLPLMPLAIEQFDLSSYDIVISSSYAVAKGVLTGPEQLHVCYCHSPIRYGWDLQAQYLDRVNLRFGPLGLASRFLLHYLRIWDLRTAPGVNLFLANSAFVGRRIQKVYRRESKVLYPPVDTERFKLEDGRRDDYYLTVSRLVPYKKVDVIVRAFNGMPDRRLMVVGNGPELRKLKGLAGANITFTGRQPEEEVIRWMQRARAFVFAAAEDFGVVLGEAQACGTPVIAYGYGGATESIIPGRTGVFYNEQTPEKLCGAVLKFEGMERCFDPAVIRRNAERFSAERFRTEFARCIDEAWNAFQDTNIAHC